MARKPIVLIVEDHQTMRETLAQIVEMEDMHALTTAKGDNMLKLLKQYHPDVIILDIDLGGKVTGVDILRALKNHATFSHIPVILHTSESGITNMKEAELADLTILKPADPDELATLIKRVLWMRGHKQFT